MEALPHHYTVSAHGNASESHVAIRSSGVVDITTDAPAEFGGPGDQWSPEGLIMAAVADCFVLSFRAIARASNVEWMTIHCEATGTLDRVDRKNQFTEITLKVTVTGNEDPGKLDRALHKAEESCLITNSMTATVTLNTEITAA